MTPSRASKVAAVALVATALVALTEVQAATLSPTQDGSEQWISRYQPTGANAGGLEPLVAPDGSALYSIGHVSHDDSSSSYRVVAFDPATGDELWAAERPGSAHAAALSADGSRIYLAGITRTDDVTYQDWIVVALDTSNGAQLWSSIYEQPGKRDAPNDIAVSRDDTRVHVVGRSLELKRRSADLTLVTLDAGTGEEQWADLYDGPDGRHDEAFAVAAGGDDVYVTGHVAIGDTETFGIRDTAYGTIAYDAVSGTRKWIARYNGPGKKYSSDVPAAIATDGDAVYVTGQSTSANNAPDWLTVAYRARDGSKQWTARYNRRSGSEDHPYSLVLGPAGGRVYVTGSSAVRDSESVTAAYRTRNGTRAWVSRYGTNGREDIGWDVAASPDGERVYATAFSVVQASEKSDFVTIGYSADNGNVLWAARYGGPGGSDDSFPTVAVTPDSQRVFVVGREWLDGSIVFTTVAYRPGSE